jgi:hypothetical protein
VKLVLPFPQAYVAREQAPGVMYERGPELRVYVASVTPLPYDLRQWGDEIVLAGLTLDHLVVRNVDDLHTTTGWPLTLIDSDVVNPADRTPIVRRIHALYRFLEFGAVAVVSGTPAYVELFRKELTDLLRSGAPDLKTEEASSIADFFAGVALDDSPAPGGGRGA